MKTLIAAVVATTFSLGAFAQASKPMMKEPMMKASAPMMKASSSAMSSSMPASGAMKHSAKPMKKAASAM